MSSPKAFIIRVHGRVQSVGYRRFILDTAQEMGLQGYITNEEDGSVTVFAQGQSEVLDRFLEALKKAPPQVIIRTFDVEEASPDPNLKGFKVKYGALAEELQEGFGAMQAEFSDYRAEFKDYRSEFKDYRNEFRDFREDFADYRAEFKDYRSEFRGFASRTDSNFQTMEDRYGAISDKLAKAVEALQAESAETRTILADAVDSLKRESAETRAELKRSVDNLARVIEKFMETISKTKARQKADT